MTRLAFAVALAASLLASLATVAAPAPPTAPAVAPVAHVPRVDFGGPEAVIELKDALSLYRAPGVPGAATSTWYMLNAVNNSKRPAIRVLQAGQPASTGLRIFPLSTRPSIVNIASTDPGVAVETAKAYGRRSYRIAIPAFDDRGLGHPDRQRAVAALAARLDGAGARRSQPPARHLHGCGRRSDFRRGRDRRRLGRDDGPQATHLGGADLDARAADAPCRQRPVRCEAL